MTTPHAKNVEVGIELSLRFAPMQVRTPWGLPPMYWVVEPYFYAFITEI